MDLADCNNTKWKILNPDPQITAKIARVAGCSDIVSKLLVNRGITTPEDAFIFLNPSFSHLREPFTLKDMEKAVERICTALLNKEKILIFGDFDADGITATVILNDFFNHVEADVSWYIPHRIKEGYSLKPCHIEMAVKQKCDLLITVDCGSDSYEAVKSAIKEDIDIIITDHHEIRGCRPPASAFINPKQQDCNSGLEHLAGVGVAFYLIMALRTYLREKGFWEQEICEPKLIEYTDLFAIGTIADMVPLKDENRILSKAGISVIKQGKRAGLNSLIKISGIDPKNINSDDISFKIAPRINAAGRISHSRICVDLLSEKSSVKAEQTAFILEELNKKRQDVERWIIEEIERRIALNPDILKKTSIVMHDKTWNAGVLGIAASKITKKYNCPTVLISTANVIGITQNSSITATGSCRSVGEINIHNALSKCSHLLENFGGHAMAAGISIKPENIEKFADRFDNEIFSAISSNNLSLSSRIIVDAELNLDQITDKLLDEIDCLRPFGTDNLEPLFCCYDLKVLSSFMIISKHRKMVLEQIEKKDIKVEETLNNSIINFERDTKNSSTNRTVEAMEFNIDSQLIDSLPNYFKKLAFRIRKNRVGDKTLPHIIIEYQ